MRARTRSFLAAHSVLVLLAVGTAPAWSQPAGEWSALDTTASAPTERRELAAIYDLVNGRFLIFAGRDIQGDYHLLNEVWTLSLGLTPTWSHLDIPGPAPGERHNPQVGYDPARNRLLVFGGYGRHYPGVGPYEYLNDVWQLSLDSTPAWTELMPSGTPPTGRLAGASVYDLFRQRFVGFGGTVGLPVDTWQLDFSGDPAWTTVQTSGVSPRGGYGMGTIYDPVGDRMLIFGGSTGDDYYGVHNDTWELSLVSDPPAWRQLAPLGPLPIARRQMPAILDPLRYRMIVFGGWDGTEPPSTAMMNDTWALSLFGEPQWTQLQPEGGPPPRRDAFVSGYDPFGDRMVVFGGWSGTEYLGDTWFLSWGGFGRPASMTASSQASPSAATVRWDVQDATGPHAGIYRREPGLPWTSVATAQSDASGAVTYMDEAVTPGGRYGYLIAVPSERGAEFGGEVWVDVPGALGVDPATRPRLVLDRVRPNPAVDRLFVSFALPSAEPAHLELLDLTGRRVYSREVGSLGAGSHDLEISGARGFRPGMYFLRLAQAGRSQATRVVISGGVTQ